MKETVGAKRKKNIARGNGNKKTFRKLGEYVGKKKKNLSKRIVTSIK